VKYDSAMGSWVLRIYLRLSSSSNAMVAVLLAIYAVATIITLFAWSARGVYAVTGDEPHYLVMAESLVRHHTLELSSAYRSEFISHAIFPLGLGQPDSPLELPFAHVLPGDNGYFTWHGWGVPFLIAIPYAIAGAVGAKLMMAALGGLIVIVSWRISGVFFTTERFTSQWPRFLSVLAVAIAYPLVPSSTQIYPDMVAGLICLSGVWFLISRELPRSNLVLTAYSLLFAYLPWLGMKYLVTSLLLLAAMTWSLGHDRIRRLLWLIIPVALSWALLCWYNMQAFGRLSGPRLEDSLEATLTSFMVFLGLIFDQDQGSLLENPVLWIALIGLIPLFRSFRKVTIAWALIFASIWIPSAMHPGWYGLGSFVGRYSWALSVLLIVPALLALSIVAARWRKVFAILLAAGIGFHLLVLALITITGGAGPGISLGLDLFTKPPGTWLESYSIFYFPIQNWFPAYYNVDWAFTYLTNYAWLILAAGLIVIAVRVRIGAVVVVIGMLAILISGFFSQPGPRSEWIAIDASSTGKPGYLALQPLRQMRQGPYFWKVTYTASASPQVTIGRWELVETHTYTVVASGPLMGTAGQQRTESVSIPFRTLQPREYQLRVADYAQGEVTIHATGVEHG
jgi:hypothetical protein